MTDSLTGIEARLERAVEQSTELTNLIKAHFDRDGGGNGPGPVVNADPLSHHIEVHFAAAGAFPLDWSVRFGEMVYLIRSSFDHLACLLVSKAGGTVITRTQFPIFVDKSKYTKEAPRMMDGMTTAAQNLIESLQPSEVMPSDPDASVLWLLHTMCNVDKHRMLHLTDAWLIDWHLDLDPDIAGLVPTVAREGGVISDGEVIVALDLPPTTSGSIDVRFTGEMSVAVRDQAGLDDQGNPAPIEIGSFVHQCVNALRSQLLPQFVPLLT